jgi:hypothetical protein
MRDYLSIGNFAKAALLGGAVTLLSIPRFTDGGMPLALYVPASLATMTLVAGAATAWGRRAGMAGVWPERRRALWGVVIGALLGGALALVYVRTDPVCRDAIARTGDSRLLALQFPATASGRFALSLWSAGFGTLFFCAATMSFLARLTGRQWLAVLGAVVIRLFLVHHRLASEGVTQSIPIFLLRNAVVSAASCTFFARFGLPSAMTFSWVLELRHLFLA